MFYSNAVYQSLIDRIILPTTAPFLDILCTWINEGRLDDKNREFFINENILNDNIFEAYTTFDKNVPCALISCYSKILTIGIYQNILAKSNQMNRPLISRSDLAYDQTVLHKAVSQMFSSTNRAMMNILQVNNGLFNLLSLMKSVFMVEKADKISEFLDVSESELVKPSKEIDYLWLKRKLEEVWGFNDGIDQLICYASDHNLFDQLLGIIGNAGRPCETHREKVLNGFDALCLDYTVPFPLNLVITKDCLSKYQIVFRMLFSTNNLLSKLDKKRKFKKYSPKLQKYLSFPKQIMLNFVQSYHSYLAYQIFQPQFNALAKNIEEATGIDIIIAAHANYLDSCLRESLLTNSKLVQLLSNLFYLTNCYCELLDAVTGSTMSVPEEEIYNQMEQIESSFSKHFRVFLEALQYYSSRDSDQYLGNLLTHLDFNSFYYNSAYSRHGNDAHPIGGLVTQ